MYFAKYENLSRHKKLLFKPLSFELKTRKISYLKNFFSNFLPFQDVLINEVINDYIKEQKFILDNKDKILEDIEKTNFKSFYTKEDSLDNYLLDYTRDYFKITTDGELRVSIYLERLKYFFYLCELLFYIQNDLTILAKKNNVIWIKSRGKYKENYFRKWFASQWEKEAQMTIISMSSLLYVNKLKGKNLKEAINLIQNLILDRLFFMHPDYLEEDIVDKGYEYIYKLCQFFALLLLIENHRINLNHPLLEELEFKNDKFLDNLIKEQKRIYILDRAFNIKNNEIYLIETNDIVNITKCAVREHYNHNMTNVSREFGDLFENYISLYIKDNMSNDYEIIENVINCQKLDDCKDLKLDIDLTIYDKKKDFYYFTQIKYSMINKAYLKDEIKSITDNKTLRKGINQLKNFPEGLKYNSFVERLKEYGIKIKNNNYALIVIHTTPQFDFQEVGKVKLYEWNTFRNLLDRGKQRKMNINRHNQTMEEISHINTLDLEDIKSVIETSMKNSSINFKEEWRNFYNQYYDFEVSNHKYRCNIK